MLHGLIFTAGLLILSGAIAYMGDRVGRRVARRKLHILGLRPGVISSATAVLTGIVIAVGTFLIITAVSADVRRMFFEYDQTLAALANAKAEYQAAQAKNDQLKKNNEHLQQQLTETTARQVQVSGELTATQGRLKTSSSKLASVQKQLDENRSKLADAEGRLASTSKKLDTAKASLNSSEKEIGELEKNKKNLEELRQGLVAEGKKLEAEIDRLKTRRLIIEANRPLAYLPVSHSTNLTDARNDILSVLYQIKVRLQSKNLQLADITTGEINNLLDLLSKRSGDVVIVFATESNVVAGEKVSVRYTVIPNDTIFAKGETVVKKDIAAGQSRDLVETALRQMLLDARGIALDRGLLPDVETGEVGSIPAAKFNEAVAALVGRKESAEVSLVSSDNVTTLGDLNAIEFTIR